MPKLTQTMDAGVLVAWLKQPGDRVEKGDPLFVMETDKAAVEVEAPASGVLTSVLAAPGDTLPVSTLIGYIASPGESIGALQGAEPSIVVAAAATAAAAASSSATPPDATARDGGLRASPVAKKLAEQYGVDLTKVIGSGPGGRIVREDILRVAGAGEQETSAQPVPEAPTAVASPAPAESGKLIVLRGMRKAIAEQMSYSARTAPQVTITMEVDMGDAVRMREQLLPEIEKSAGVRLSVNHLLLKAVAMAMAEHPMLNSRWTDEGIVVLDEVNLGVAVAVEEGLVVPVLRNAESRSLVDIVRQAVHLAERAKEHRLTQQEFSGGTFTVSNLGMYGVEAFTPIVNPPETAILGAGRCAKKAVVVDDELVPRWMMTLSLSFDHRVVDGAQAAQFLARVKDILERPAVMAL